MTHLIAMSFGSTALLLGSMTSILPAQAPSGRIEVRALAATAVPLNPTEFSSRWNPGPGGAVAIGYDLRAGTALSAEIEYGRFPERELALPVILEAGIPSGTTRTNAPTASLWAAWLDISQRLRDGAVQPRIHGGLGVVSFGASRTGLGLRAGAGIDVPVSGRMDLILDLTFAHAFTQAEAGTYALSTPFSYLPLRAGVRWK